MSCVDQLHALSVVDCVSAEVDATAEQDQDEMDIDEDAEQTEQLDEDEQLCWLSCPNIGMCEGVHAAKSGVTLLASSDSSPSPLPHL